MPESSYPIPGDELTDPLWRGLFADQAGIIADYDGSSYDLTLSTNSDVASLGSTTQDSLARVAGFGHRVDKVVVGGATPVAPATVTIPPVTTGTTRTDVIALRYDPAYSGAQGPVRLVVIPGVPGSTALPVVDSTYPGVQNEPLWAVTRTPSTALSQATRQDLRRRMATTSTMPAGSPVPETAPLGTVLTIGTLQRLRVMSGSTPTWSTVPNDVVERLTALTRRTPHYGAPWGSGGVYGPWYVTDGNWNVAPGSAIKAAGCIKGHVYLVSTTFTLTAAHQLPDIRARLGLLVGQTRPTSRVPSNTVTLSQQTAIISALSGTDYQQTNPTTLVQRWECTTDGDYWFYPAFASNTPNGYCVQSLFGSPITEVTDLGPMTNVAPEQAP